MYRYVLLFSMLMSLGADVLPHLWSKETQFEVPFDSHSNCGFIEEGDSPTREDEVVSVSTAILWNIYVADRMTGDTPCIYPRQEIHCSRLPLSGACTSHSHYTAS